MLIYSGVLIIELLSSANGSLWFEFTTGANFGTQFYTLSRPVQSGFFALAIFSVSVIVDSVDV